MEKSIRDQIYSIAADVELDLQVDLEKARELLFEIRERLFDSAEPSKDYEYLYTRFHYLAAIVSDHIYFAEKSAEAIGNRLYEMIGVQTKKTDQ